MIPGSLHYWITKNQHAEPWIQPLASLSVPTILIQPVYIMWYGQDVLPILKTVSRASQNHITRCNYLAQVGSSMFLQGRYKWISSLAVNSPDFETNLKGETLLLLWRTQLNLHSLPTLPVQQAVEACSMPIFERQWLLMLWIADVPAVLSTDDSWRASMDAETVGCALPR